MSKVAEAMLDQYSFFDSGCVVYNTAHKTPAINKESTCPTKTATTYSAKKTYRYRGGVYMFGKYIETVDKQTEAVSPSKALANIEYQCYLKSGKRVKCLDKDKLQVVC